LAGIIKKLAGQTALYGLSSILPRFLNYALVPLHTALYSTNQYGIITEMYAYVAFLVILLTYGMETAYFRFTNKEGNEESLVFGTVLRSVLTTSFVFIITAIFFQQGIADWLKYANHSEYVVWFAIIIGLDAISAIPLARLRHQNKPIRFASINLSSVIVNVALNFFFLGYCMTNYQAGNTNVIIDALYSPEIGVGYVFISNLAASIFKILMSIPTFYRVKLTFDLSLLKKLLIYGSPLLIAGLAGIVNETLDRILLKHLLYDTLGEVKAMSQLGIYGACYKLSIIITLFIQAFRYAAEPFFFAQAKNKNAPEVYANVMNYFVAVCGLIFLGVTLYLDIIKYFIPNSDYWEGLKVVPILLLANICLGIYFNQSIWYKMTDKTKYGAYIAIGGAIITIALNLLLIPTMGYMGSAWTTLVVYALMVISSYFLGQKHFPVPYNLTKVGSYLGMSLILFFGGTWMQNEYGFDYLIATVAILIFVGMVYWSEVKMTKTTITNES